MTNIPSIKRLQQPVSEPLTLDEVKIYLRIDGESENELLNSMITATRELAEKYLSASLINQQWKIAYDETLPETVRLYNGPVNSVESMKLIDEAGGETVFASSNYYLKADNHYLHFKNIPSARRIEISYNTGYGATAEDIPEVLKQGLLALIGKVYERKSEIVDISGLSKIFFDFYREIKL